MPSLSVSGGRDDGAVRPRHCAPARRPRRSRSRRRRRAGPRPPRRPRPSGPRGRRRAPPWPGRRCRSTEHDPGRRIPDRVRPGEGETGHEEQNTLRQGGGTTGGQAHPAGGIRGDDAQRAVPEVDGQGGQEEECGGPERGPGTGPGGAHGGGHRIRPGRPGPARVGCAERGPRWRFQEEGGALVVLVDHWFLRVIHKVDRFSQDNPTPLRPRQGHPDGPFPPGRPWPPPPRRRRARVHVPWGVCGNRTVTLILVA